MLHTVFATLRGILSDSHPYQQHGIRSVLPRPPSPKRLLGMKGTSPRFEFEMSYQECKRLYIKNCATFAFGAWKGLESFLEAVESMLCCTWLIGLRFALLDLFHDEKTRASRRLNTLKRLCFIGNVADGTIQAMLLPFTLVGKIATFMSNRSFGLQTFACFFLN